MKQNIRVPNDLSGPFYVVIDNNNLYSQYGTGIQWYTIKVYRT